MELSVLHRVPQVLQVRLDHRVILVEVAATVKRVPQVLQVRLDHRVRLDRLEERTDRCSTTREERSQDQTI